MGREEAGGERSVGAAGPGRRPMRSIFGPELRAVSVSTLAIVALVAFEALAVVTILPAITADLGDVQLYSWILNSFLLTSTVSILLAGPVIDAVGLSRVFRFAVVVFAAASALAVAAPSVPALIAIRTIQGVGGGLLLAAALAAVGILYPSELRSRGYAANSVIWGIASLAGPGLAATLAIVLSWRSIFVVKAAASVVVGAVAWKRFPTLERHSSVLPRMDPVGASLLLAFTAVTLLGLSSVSLTSLATLAGGAGLFGLYWWHAGRSATPPLPRRFVASLPFGPMNLIGFVSFSAVLGVEAYLPLYVVGGLGRSALAGGAALVVMSTMWSVGSVGASRLLDHFSETRIMATGFSLLAAAAAAGLAFYTRTTPLWVVAAIAIVQGAGIGMAANAALTLLPSLARTEEVGRVTTTFQYLRNLGQACGVAASGAVVFLIVRNRVGDVEPVRQVLAGKEVALGEATRSALASGFRLAHAIPAVAAALGLGTVLFLERRLAAKPSLRRL